MDRLKMQSENLVDENVEFIAKKFPNCIVEARDEDGKLTKIVDFDLLKQELSKVVVEGNEERYVLNWPDKKRAILTANAPISKTLRPVVEDEVKPTGCDSNGQPYLSSGSVGKDGTLNKFDSENLYIEGDNLDVLKLLRETYLNKIKMIYIDPPYNTGNDFVYEDDFAIDAEEYLQISNQIDEHGNRMFVNNESNGRFHTDWLNMMYPRLKLARDLLADDGVIFISIDDNEQENLKKICDEIFGEQNFVSQIVWERAYSPINLKKHFSVSHDYILCYTKNINNSICNGLPRSNDANNRYINPDNDPRGVWKSACLYVGPVVESKLYPITIPSGRVVYPASGYCWLFTKERYEEMLKDNRIYFGPNGDSTPSLKRFLSEVKSTITPMSVWKYNEVGHSQEAMQSLKKLFDGKAFFDYPKPVELIKRCLQLYSDKDSYILDFFSGSATTAHAVMQLNAEDGGNRKFIMVQLPEVTAENSEAFKAGYKNICEIGKERIRRAGKKIKNLESLDGMVVAHRLTGKDKLTEKDIEEFKKTEKYQEWSNRFDSGFRVLKLDSSNMKDVYYNPADIKQNLLTQFESNIKEDRSAEDLLFQVMLDMGVELSKAIEKKTIKNKTVYVVGEYDEDVQPNLICCFDENIDEEVITEIAKLKPLYAIFRDSSFVSDSMSVNFDQIFETYSPNTTRKVL